MGNFLWVIFWHKPNHLKITSYIVFGVTWHESTQFGISYKWQCRNENVISRSGRIDTTSGFLYMVRDPRWHLLKTAISDFFDVHFPLIEWSVIIHVSKVDYAYMVVPVLSWCQSLCRGELWCHVEPCCYVELWFCDEPSSHHRTIAGLWCHPVTLGCGVMVSCALVWPMSSWEWQVVQWWAVELWYDLVYQ